MAAKPGLGTGSSAERGVVLRGEPVPNPGVGKSPFSRSASSKGGQGGAGVTPVDASVQAAAHANNMNEMAFKEQLGVWGHGQKLAAQNEYEEYAHGRSMNAAQAEHFRGIETIRAQGRQSRLGKLEVKDLHDFIDLDQADAHLAAGNVDLARHYADRYQNRRAGHQSMAEGPMSGGQMQEVVAEKEEPTPKGGEQGAAPPTGPGGFARPFAKPGGATPPPAAPPGPGGFARPYGKPGFTPVSETPKAEPSAESPAAESPASEPAAPQSHASESAAAEPAPTPEREAADAGESPSVAGDKAAEGSPSDAVAPEVKAKEPEEAAGPSFEEVSGGSGGGQPKFDAPVQIPSASTPPQASAGRGAPGRQVTELPPIPENAPVSVSNVEEGQQRIAPALKARRAAAAAASPAAAQPAQPAQANPDVTMTNPRGIPAQQQVSSIEQTTGRNSHFDRGRGVLKQAASRVFPTNTGRGWGPQGGEWKEHEDAPQGRLLDPSHKDAGAYNQALTNWNAANNLPAPIPHDWSGHYYQHPQNAAAREGAPPPAGGGHSLVRDVAAGALAGATTGRRAGMAAAVFTEGVSLPVATGVGAGVGAAVGAAKHYKGSPPPVHEHAPLAKNGNPVFISKSAPVSPEERSKHNRDVLAWRKAQLGEGE